MRRDKIEDLIRRFTRDLEELVRSELRAEVSRAVEACLAAPPQATRRARRSSPKSAAPEPAPETATAPKPAPEPETRRRGWTREAVIAELATWLLTGTVVEAAFVTRHGKPGLVAAARKHFGRFDAALNAANVHLARLHPEGPPTTKRSMQAP